MADFSFGNENGISGNENASDGPITASFLIDDSGSNGTATGDGFDPAIHVSRDKRNADGSYTRKRGRRAGSTASGNHRGESSRKANHTASVESLTRVLAVLHLGIAAATKAPEMALEDQEAEALATATSNVLKEFDIQPNPKVEALVALAMTAGSIYGPRIYLIGERRKREKANGTKRAD